MYIKITTNHTYLHQKNAHIIKYENNCSCVRVCIYVKSCVHAEESKSATLTTVLKLGNVVRMYFNTF